MVKKIRGKKGMRFRYTRHAVQRMAERGLGVEKVEDIIQSGTIIARYEDDRPFPVI